MTFTDDEVIQILRLLEQSSFDEMNIETNGLKLVVRRRGGGAVPEEWERSAAAPVAAASAQSGAALRDGSAGDASGATAASPSPSTAPVATAVVEEAGLVAVTAPNLGTFYRAPKPGAPPFVDVGTVVAEDDTVCLLEVMKCFITVKAKTRGEIVKVCVENAQMVEFGQSLFLIRPSDRA